MYNSINAHEYRKKEHNVNDMFIERWSPRALNGEPLDKEDLLTLLEAARWAPSSYNGQPWRFIYGIKGTDEYDKLFSLLVEFNQQWTKNAGALLLVVSKKTFEHNGEPNGVHSFDAGSAWMSMALQASDMSIVAHGMAGFDHDNAREMFSIPDDFAIDAMIALGYPGKKEDLPLEMQKGEEPSGRKSVVEIAANGKMPE